MLIGIAGRLGSGKSTVSEHIKSINPYFKERHFAFKLKQVASILSGLPIELAYSQKGKNTLIQDFDMTLGELLQIVGDGLRDLVVPDIWIHSTMKNINLQHDYIFSDCRYHNELNSIKDKGGYLIKIERPDNPIATESSRDVSHKSEQLIDTYQDYDYIIINNGDLYQLFSKITKIYQEILEREQNKNNI